MVRFFRVHLVDKSLEKRQQVMRAGTGLRMALKTESRPVGKCDALQAAIKQGAMRRFHVVRQARFVNRKAVILTTDYHLTGRDVLHRVIGAMDAKKRTTKRAVLST